MDNVLNGKQTLLYIDTVTPITTPGLSVDVPGSFELVACLTDNSFEGTRDAIDTTSKCSGLFKDSMPGEIGWTFSGNGNAISIESGDDRLSHNALFQLWKNGTTFWVAQFDDELESVRYGLAYITSFSEANPNNAAKTFSITLQGKGEVYDQTATT